MAKRLRLDHVLGLQDPLPRLREAWVAFRGAEHVPPSRFGLSSVRMLRPRISIPLWMGKAPVARHAIVTNLYNHTQTAVEDGWSVKVTQVRDFRGGSLTYDSHNGTDFSIPVGSLVCAPADGEIVRRYSEYNRGGHKLVIDHGRGLFTSYAHLSEFLVDSGERVSMGQPIAVSGYSGLDGLATFPLGTPHVHVNVWLAAVPTDPFAHDAEPSLWLDGDSPRPRQPSPSCESERTEFDMDAVDTTIAACLSQDTRDALTRIHDDYARATRLVSEKNYYPTRFPESPPLIETPMPRQPCLSLPLSATEFDGVIFVDEL